MLTMIQFPIADLRSLIDTRPPCRTLAPSLPPSVVATPRQFLHYFGTARCRSQATDLAWVDETSFFNAARALRLPGTPSRSAGALPLTCAFRRLLHDDTVVARVEVGFGLLRPSQQAKLWKTMTHNIALYGSTERAVAEVGLPEVAPLELLTQVMNVRSLVPLMGDLKGATEAVAPRALVRQGTHLARLLFHATCPREARAMYVEGADWNQYVAPASPVAIVECSNKWFETLPRSFTEVRPVKRLDRVRVAYGKLLTSLGRIDAWIIGCDATPSTLVRNLRSCLLRLHAEHQILALVLDRLHTGALTFKAGTPSGDSFEDYFNKATRSIERESWCKEIKQPELLSAFDAVRASHAPACRALSSRLDDVRLQVRRKVERFLARAPGITIETLEGDITMDHHDITITGSYVEGSVVIAQTIQDSFNTLAQSNVDKEIRDCMEQLLAQVRDIAAKAPPPDALNLTKSAQRVTDEITRREPQRKFYELSVEGLKDAAKAVGEVGKPILETAGKLLPLLVALWP